MTTYRQYELHSENRWLVTWLEDKKLELGAKVELKEYPGQWWEVRSIGETALTKAQVDDRNKSIRKGVFGSIKKDQ